MTKIKSVKIECQINRDRVSQIEHAVSVGSTKLRTCESVVRAIAFATSLDGVDKSTPFYFEGFEHIQRGMTLIGDEEYRKTIEDLRSLDCGETLPGTVDPAIKS